LQKKGAAPSHSSNRANVLRLPAHQFLAIIRDMCSKEHAFVHESGHALMAVSQKIFFSGICYCTSDHKYCTLVSEPSFANLSKDYYLFTAGGMAAELVVYGNYDEGPAKLDKADFTNQGAPPLEETISEAKDVLSGYVLLIQKLASILLEKDKHKEDFPEVGMDNDDRKFRVLLNKDEVEDALHSS
jgi:hypothetical protein